MSRLAKQVAEIGVTDTLAAQDTPVHRLDPRAKLAATVLYLGVVVSFDRFTVSALIPLVFFPVYLCASGRIPPGYIFRKMVWVSPFALAAAAVNPFLDTQPLTTFCGMNISAGQVSFLSVILRFALTVGATLALLAVTGFYRLVWAAERLGLPKVLAVQLMFFFRYLFVLAAEAIRMMRARSLRTFSNRGMGLRSYGPLTGRLLLRTLDRAERIYTAMTARGFAGTVHSLSPHRFRMRDGIFVAGWTLFFATVRWIDLPAALGRAAMEWM